MPHLSPQRALARGSGDLSAQGRARGLAQARSDQNLPRAAAAVRRRGKRDRGDRCGGTQRGRSSDREVQGGGAAAARNSHDRRLRRWGLGMAELTYREAVARGIAQEMTRDPDVVFLGEDVAKAGGVFKATV